MTTFADRLASSRLGYSDGLAGEITSSGDLASHNLGLWHRAVNDASVKLLASALLDGLPVVYDAEAMTFRVEVHGA